MNKPLDEDAIARAVRESVKLAVNGTPEQQAGMFKPRAAPSNVPNIPRRRKTA